MACRRCAEGFWTTIGGGDYLGILERLFSAYIINRLSFGLGNGPGNVRLGLDLSCCPTRDNNLEERSAWSGGSNRAVVGRQFAVWNLRSEDPVWTGVWWFGRSHRLDGLDGDFCNAGLCWRGLEIRKCYSGLEGWGETW